jgi:adenylosuccinate synthase
MKQIDNLESTLGVAPIPPPVITPVQEKTKRSHGIDVVLGAQWGDEGKGKLVDLLSQVCTFVTGGRSPFLVCHP